MYLVVLRRCRLGMKPYPNMGLAYDHALWEPWWEFGNRHGLYCLCHMAAVTGGVPAVARLAERYPNVSWIIAHSGSGWAMAVEVAECVAGATHKNVYAELTYTAVTNGVVEYLVKTTDSHHVLFGTGNARIENVGKSQSCMVSKSPIICPRRLADARPSASTWLGRLGGSFG